MDDIKPNETYKRRLYFPTYSQTFSLWMCYEIICAEFLRLFASNGKQVTLTEKPKSEQILSLGKGIRGVRFDVVAKTEDYHIYCIESQRDFMRESYTVRTLYYGCIAMATKSLKQKEDFKELRPVTVIFVYIDNTASTEPIDVMNVYKRKDVEESYTTKQVLPYNVN